jgi:hypothetical protein
LWYESCRPVGHVDMSTVNISLLTPIGFAPLRLTSVHRNWSPSYSDQEHQTLFRTQILYIQFIHVFQHWEYIMKEHWNYSFCNIFAILQHSSMTTKNHFEQFPNTKVKNLGHLIFFNILSSFCFLNLWFNYSYNWITKKVTTEILYKKETCVFAH